MSSKAPKRIIKLPKPEPIVTRNKSAQLKRQLVIESKEKKTEKPKLTKTTTKSTKTKKVIRSKGTQHKNVVKDSVVVIEQIEYYPNKLKRNVCTKKVLLKPKHNFKVIAATNKRKMATPQKGIKSPATPKKLNAQSLLKSTQSLRTCSSSDLSMQDMVRLMDETQSLSEEDFMEILTCPSPVWWEDPPDGVYDEESLYTRPPEPPEKLSKNNKRKSIKTTPKPNNKTTNNEQLKIIATPTINKDEKFVKKKQKLESILGNIKNKTVKNSKTEADNYGSRKFSESEGDISDLSFNEEEILKNLENMDIPIEESVTESNEKPLVSTKERDNLEIKKEINDKDIKQEIITNYTNENDVGLASKNENLDRFLEKSEIKNEISIKSPVSNVDQNICKVSSRKRTSNTDEKSDEIIILDSCESCLDNNKNSTSLLEVDTSSKPRNSPKEKVSNTKESNISNPDLVPVKKTNDLSEYITVYKIIPDKLKNPKNDLKPIENNNNIKKTKMDNAKGKLNDFFKKCKNNKRLKKECPVPAIPVTDVKETIDIKKEIDENIIDLEEENRLKGCDCCIEKTVNGVTVFSCEKCELAPILPCDSCNFIADSKEVFKKHVSSCKEITRISWSNNYLLNQT